MQRFSKFVFVAIFSFILLLGICSAADDEDGNARPLSWSEVYYRAQSELLNLLGDAVNDWVNDVSNTLNDWFLSSDVPPEPPVVNNGGWKLLNNSASTYLTPSIRFVYSNNGNIVSKTYRNKPLVADYLGISAPFTVCAASDTYVNTERFLSGVACYLYNDSIVSFISFFKSPGDFSSFTVSSLSFYIESTLDHDINLYNNYDDSVLVVSPGLNSYSVRFDFPVFGVPGEGIYWLFDFKLSEEPFISFPGTGGSAALTFPPEIPYPLRDDFSDDASYNIALQIYNNYQTMNNDLSFWIPSVPNDEFFPDSVKLREYPLFAFPLMMAQDLYSTCVDGYSPTLDIGIHANTDYFTINEDLSIDPRTLFGSVWNVLTYIFSFLAFYMLFHHLWDNIIMDTQEVDVN